MNIRCEKCRARYRLNVTMFKGSRGMVVRCRRCGKSILVWKPEEIASDTSVLGDVASEGGHSSRGGYRTCRFPRRGGVFFPTGGRAGSLYRSPSNIAQFPAQGSPSTHVQMALHHRLCPPGHPSCRRNRVPCLSFAWKTNVGRHWAKDRGGTYNFQILTPPGTYSGLAN